MAYIGREPQIGNYQVCDAISVVNAQAAYTMQVNSVNVIPESVNHMIVSLNGVIQNPGGDNPSYTISSSTITFSSNLATGDSIDFIYLLGNVLDLGTPSDDTVTGAKIVDNAINSEHYTDGSIDTAHIADAQITVAKMAANSIDSDQYVDGSIDTAHIAADQITAAKIADDAISEEHLDVTAVTGHTAETSIADGDLVLIHDASASALRKMTKANFVSGLGGSNSPSFRAYSASAQNLTNNTALKIVFGTEDFDTNSDFASSRFTPTVAGTYFVFSQIVISNDSVAEALKYGVNIMKKNTSELVRNNVDAKNSSPANQSANYVATLVAMNGSSDYIEVFGQADASAGTAQVGNGSNQTYFGAFKLI